MKRLTILMLTLLLMAATACDRRPGQAVDAPLENPGGSLEELEEATNEEPLADAPIPGEEADTVSGDEGVEPVLEGTAEITPASAEADESASEAPNVSEADAAEVTEAEQEAGETEEAEGGDTQTESDNDGEVSQEPGDLAGGLLGTARLINAEGTEVGVANLLSSDEGVVVEFGLLEGADISPGEHGFHVHETGACTPDFEAAGSHLNPEDAEHGLENPAGPHTGDLPNLEVSEDGEVTYVAVSDRLSEDLLFDDDGSAIIIHAQPDDQVTDPGGSSGERVACGVLEQSPGSE